jgi:hypothetical protein
MHMHDEAEVYDLGDLEAQGQPRRQPQPQAAGLASVPPPRARRAPAVRPASYEPHVPRWPVGLALFVPGGGHIASGRVSTGLGFLAAAGFLVTLAWALLNTLDRLGRTLALFELPPEAGVWALAALCVAVALLHVFNVVGASPGAAGERVGAPHPVVAGVASAIVPGWGQALSGHRVSAALFLTGCWIAAASWLLVSAPVQGLLDAQGLYLPRWLALIGSAPVRWTLPAVLWILAVYDAVVRARAKSGAAG